jgi:SNF2 family DNA or RNA helicase
MEFLNPRYLGPEATFHRRFAVPIERYSDETQSATLRRLIQPFVLRRVKTDPKVIQDLPDKVEQKVFCPLTPEQATLYEAVVKDMLAQLDDAEGMARRGMVLATLMKLKQVCNHPAHFLGDGSALPHRSGKLNRLEELLEEALSVQDRALVFTQFAAMGEHLQRHLRQRFGIEVLFLHGGVPRAKRDQMVTRFQTPEGPPVMVLSLKAGGVGLNMTRANHVFHFDRWWNPAVENQATDRAFRIGQQRNVHVHRFVCNGTVEERIDALIESKLALAESIVGAGESWITELSSAELRDLFTLRREAVAEEA